MKRPAQRRELAVKAVAMKGVSIALACRAFDVSETCYRYGPNRDDENEQIADLLLGLTRAKKTWGIEIDFSLPAERVVRALDQIIEWRGAPKTIRVDNGPEYISGTLMEWGEHKGIALAHIQPGKPRRTLMSSATTERSGANGWTSISSKRSTRCSRLPPNSCGLTTMSVPTWAMLA